MKKKILLLGDPNSYWSIAFIKYVLLKLDAQVFVLSNHDGVGAYAKDYQNVGVKIISPEPCPTWIMDIPKVRVFAMRRKQIKAINQYAPFDVIINMFVHPSALRCSLSQKSRGTKVVAYFCGSDIIRANRFKSFILKHVLKKTDYAVMASSNVHDAFARQMNHKPVCKTTVIRLGLSVFQHIDRLLSTGEKEDYKQAFGIPSGKTTLCIGYSGSEAQNHLCVLEQISTLERDLKRKLYILLPITYGGSPEYAAQLERAVQCTGCDFQLIKEFMDSEAMAKLWLATDVFVNAQTTDGLSGSVLEALYAGANLLNAAWLQYREYDEWNIEHIRFSSYQEIPSQIACIMKKPHSASFFNKQILADKMSWQSCKEAWERLFSQMFVQ